MISDFSIKYSLMRIQGRLILARLSHEMIFFVVKSTPYALLKFLEFYVKLEIVKPLATLVKRSNKIPSRIQSHSEFASLCGDIKSLLM